MTPHFMTALRRWFDSSTDEPATVQADARGIDWLRVLPFLLLHLGCLAVPWVGVTSTAVALAIALYAVRMFAVTAFYHRYFSHRAFKTSRAAQFLFAVIGASAVQRGPLWWASHHRHHHVHSDDPDDSHSAKQHGFLWSHMGWFLARSNFRTKSHLVQDLARYPELRWLDRYDVLVPLLLAVVLYASGAWVRIAHPESGASGLQFVVWGFCVSTVALYHSTFAINSFAHRYGARRYATDDESRNSAWLALLTFGEGWHNNHHHFPGAARQGFHWYEIDLTYYGLRMLAAVGIVRDLRAVPAAMRNARMEEREESSA